LAESSIAVKKINLLQGAATPHPACTPTGPLRVRFLPFLLLALVSVSPAHDSVSTAQVSVSQRLVDDKLHHLRAGDVREWSEFPEQAEGPRLVVRFRSEANAAQQTLRLYQYDVKQPWRVLLNEKQLGKLERDENAAIIYLAIPPGRLASGENTLVIEQTNGIADDIRVGDLRIDPRPLKDVMNEITVELKVFDATDPNRKVLTPCRITVVNETGALVHTAAVSNDKLAVRPGVIYSGNGQARFSLPAGDYTIYAGRGFEYSIDSVQVLLVAGAGIHKELTIRREVPTDGYVSCDTHVHTLTYSGHGDATIDERMLTLAGEGIELPIATDHNRHIDYDAVARKLGVRKYFTPVIGNEVTTSLGHFNIFPVAADARVPDFQLKDGNAVLDSIAERTGAKAIVLNHPRDVHSGFRPFGPERHNAASGENDADWLFRAHGVELVNSGAQQSDVLQTYRDWFALLNRGIFLTPVGSSDSHDVSRFIVGQGRTYIRCPDDRPDKIDVDDAVESFVAGRVLVSCGLLVDMTVNDEFGPGDMVPATAETRVAVRVLGPSWTTAAKVTLYANGIAIREAAIDDGSRGGVKWSGQWKLPKLKQDVHLVAVATGPGITKLYWPIAKSYQPMSPVVERRIIGSTGAVWLDADGDGRRTSALEYATRLVEKHGGSAAKVVQTLADYDESVAVQAAELLHARGVSPDDAEPRAAAKKAGRHVEHGFRAYFDAWRVSEIARSK
jgi:hypothetical protein